MLRDAHPAIVGTVCGASSIHILGAGLNPRSRPIEPFTTSTARVGVWCRFIPEMLAEPSWVARFAPPLSQASNPKWWCFSSPPNEPNKPSWNSWFAMDRKACRCCGSNRVQNTKTCWKCSTMPAFSTSWMIVSCALFSVTTSRANTAEPEPWYLQVQSDDESGCSVWSVESATGHEGRTRNRAGMVR